MNSGPVYVVLLSLGIFMIVGGLPAVAPTMGMQRIEGARSILSYLQLAAASGNFLIRPFAAYARLSILFRPDNPASSTQVSSDYVWPTVVGGTIQSLATGVCILTDKSPIKVYSRFVAYILTMWWMTVRGIKQAPAINDVIGESTLASDAARHITGQVLVVDGGQTLAGRLNLTKSEGLAPRDFHRCFGSKTFHAPPNGACVTSILGIARR
jgi:hypothetical protein